MTRDGRLHWDSQCVFDSIMQYKGEGSSRACTRIRDMKGTWMKIAGFLGLDLAHDVFEGPMSSTVRREAADDNVDASSSMTTAWMIASACDCILTRRPHLCEV